MKKNNSLFCFRMLIIENFIPSEDKVKIQNRAYYDEDDDSWKLKALANKKYVFHEQNKGIHKS